MNEYMAYPVSPFPQDEFLLSADSATRDKLSPVLAAQLAASGVAEAIVVLRGPKAGLTAAENESHAMAAALCDAFVVDRNSPAQMIRRATRPTAARVRNLERAGVSLVDGDIAAGMAGESRASLFAALGVMIGDVRADGAERLAADERVEYVASAVPFSLVRPVRSASAKLGTTTTWGIEQLGIPKLWAAGLDGSGVLVGHLDTGADGTHPALKNAIEKFLYVDPAGFPGKGGTAYDTDRHGTHTAATIAARAVSGRHVGVAPAASLAVAAVIEGGDAARRILTGLNWAVTQGVKIVSLSLGFRGYVADLYPIMQRVRERGVLPVVAVGNEGPGTSRSPGNYDLVLSVGASDKNKRVAGFSSSQRFSRPVDPIVPDVVAPGVDVISAVPGTGFMAMSGSSMATPHIAGLAALLWQAKPDATVDEIERSIFHSATRGRTLTEERAGRGLPDGPKAYQALTGTKLPAAPSKTSGRPASKAKVAAKPRRTAKRKK